MKVTAYKLRKIVPPKDDLFSAITESKLSPKEGDIIAISSKVVSIAEGRTIPIDFVNLTEKERAAEREVLIKKEADWYFKAPATSKYRRYFTIAKGAMVGSGGVDESNGDGYYILYPKNPFVSAKHLRKWFMKTYNLQKLAVIITDSTSSPLRRGVMGFALSWDGLEPLKDYRGTPDIFGRSMRIEMANIVDALAASAVLVMGEGNEQTPVAVIRDVTGLVFKNRSNLNPEQLIVSPDNDVFAPLIWRAGWKRSGGSGG